MENLVDGIPYAKQLTAVIEAGNYPTNVSEQKQAHIEQLYRDGQIDEALIQLSDIIGGKNPDDVSKPGVSTELPDGKIATVIDKDKASYTRDPATDEATGANVGPDIEAHKNEDKAGKKVVIKDPTTVKKEKTKL